MEDKLIVRKIKIPIDVSKETLEQIFSKMRGVKVELTDEEYRNFTDTSPRVKLLPIIEPHWSAIKDRTDQKSLERKSDLIDFGRYVFYSGHPIAILEMPDPPDFIIQYQGEKIAVEHTSLVVADVIPKINDFRKCLKQAKEQFQEAHPDFTGLVNVFIDIEKFESRNHKQIVADIVSLLSQIKYRVDTREEGGDPLKAPDYFIDCTYVTHKIFELEQGETYFSPPLLIEHLMNRIEAKENKLEKYKKDTGLQKVWLFVVIGGSSEKSNYDVDIEKLRINYEQQFDKIILFNSFKGLWKDFEKKNT